MFTVELENGELKEYTTTWRHGEWPNSGIGSLQTYYKTYCGLEELVDDGYKYYGNFEGCKHLDCAIYAAGFTSGTGSYSGGGFLLIFVIIGFCVLGLVSFWLAIIFLISVFALDFLAQSNKGPTQAENELIEFKQNGTINGIKAKEFGKHMYAWKKVHPSKNEEYLFREVRAPLSAIRPDDLSQSDESPINSSPLKESDVHPKQSDSDTWSGGSR